jgi:hypothetical protein
MSDTLREQRREIRTIQREATWLQKALFALGKAADAREKLDSEGDAGYALELESGRLPIEDLEDAIESRVKSLLDTVRERRRTIR